MESNTKEDLPNLPKQINEELKNEEKNAKPEGNIWETLRALKKKGLFKGDIDEIIPKDFNLKTGDHYYVIDDLRKHTVKCISCPIIHGGILEAHLLTRYRVENGIIFFDEEPTNTAPKDFRVDG